MRYAIATFGPSNPSLHHFSLLHSSKTLEDSIYLLSLDDQWEVIPVYEIVTQREKKKEPEIKNLPRAPRYMSYTNSI